MTKSADSDQLASEDLHCLQRQGISNLQLASADSDQLASEDLHCLQRQGISWFSRTRVKRGLPSSLKGKIYFPLRVPIDFFPVGSCAGKQTGSHKSYHFKKKGGSCSYPCWLAWKELSSSDCSSVANCSLITSSREQGVTAVVLPHGEPPVDLLKWLCASCVASVKVPSISDFTVSFLFNLKQWIKFA